VRTGTTRDRACRRYKDWSSKIEAMGECAAPSPIGGSEASQKLSKGVQIDRFDPVRGEPRLRRGLSAKLLVSGQGDQERAVRVAIHALGHLVSAHAGKGYVEEHESRTVPIVDLERGGTVVRDRDPVSPVGEEKGKAVRGVWVVVHHQDRLDLAQVRVRPPRLKRVRRTTRSATPSTIQTQGCVYHVSVPTATVPP
jgi:hypothetical protein